MTEAPGSADTTLAQVGRRFVSGISWSIAAAFASRGLAAAGAVLIPRILGPERFGALGIIAGLLNIVSLVGMCGTNVAMTKFVSEYLVTKKDRVGSVVTANLVCAFLAGSLVTGALVAAAPYLADRVYHRPELATLFRMAAIAIFPQIVARMCNGGLSGYQAFRSLAAATTMAGLVGMPLQVVAAFVFGLPGAVAGIALLGIAQALTFGGWLWAESRKRVGPLRLRTDLPTIRMVLSFGFPQMLSAIVVTAAPFVVATFLANSSQGMVAAGWFSAAWGAWDFILFIPMAAAGPSVPIYSELLASGDRETLSATLAGNARAIWIVALLLALPLGTASPVVMQFLFGSAYQPGWPTLALLCGAAVVLAGNVVFGFLIVAYGRMWHGFWLNLSWFVLLVLGLKTLVPPFGAAGAAGAYVFAYLVFTVILAVYARVTFGLYIKGFGRASVATLLLGAATGGFAWVAPVAAAWSSLPIGAVTAAVIWRRALSASERKFVLEQAAGIWVKVRRALRRSPRDTPGPGGGSSAGG